MRSQCRIRITTNRITVMIIVASLTQGLTRATWVGDWDLGQELRAESAGRGEWASSAGGAVTSDQAGADFTRFQTLGSPDTGHWSHSVISSQWSVMQHRDIVGGCRDMWQASQHCDTFIGYTRRALHHKAVTSQSCQNGDSKIQTDGKFSIS